MRYQIDIILNYMVMNKETKFNGTVLNGFLMLFIVLGLLIATIVGIVFGIIQLDESNGACGGWLVQFPSIGA